jgi:hypothetical protein
MRAQQINRTLGGLAVMPWEVDEIPDEWLAAFESLADELPQMQRGRAQLDAAFARATGKYNRRQ